MKGFLDLCRCAVNTFWSVHVLGSWTVTDFMLTCKCHVGPAADLANACVNTQRLKSDLCPLNATCRNLTGISWYLNFSKFALVIICRSKNQRRWTIHSQFGLSVRANTASIPSNITVGCGNRSLTTSRQQQDYWMSYTTAYDYTGKQ